MSSKKNKNKKCYQWSEQTLSVPNGAKCVSLINQHNRDCFVKFKLCFDFSSRLQKSSSVLISSSETKKHILCQICSSHSVSFCFSLRCCQILIFPFAHINKLNLTSPLVTQIFRREVELLHTDLLFQS